MSQRAAHLASILLLSVSSLGALADEQPARDAGRTDTWRPALPDIAMTNLVATPEGLTFRDIGGDCWRGDETLRAAFLRREHAIAPGAYEVNVTGFIPGERFAQVGLVAWRDADNYVRHTVGFQPAGAECVGEFEQQVVVNGLHQVYPRRHPLDARLRLEIGQRTLHALLAHDNGVWQLIDAVTLPDGTTTDEFFRGIGLIGVGGRMAQPPRFTNWRHTPRATYRDCAFDTLDEQWRKCITSAGWGAAEDTFTVCDGHLVIRPTPGTDIFLGNLNYACVTQPAPTGHTWQLTTKIAAFPAATPGRYRKAGLVLFQGRKRWLAVTVVTDDHFGHMYGEFLAQGARPIGHEINVAGYGPRRTTDVYMRITKLRRGQFQGALSYDGQRWTSFPATAIELEEPSVQLFGSGDVKREYPGTDWQVRFDYIRMTRPQAEALEDDR